MPRALDPCPAGSVEPVGRLGHDRLKPHAQPDQRPAQFGKRRLRLSCLLDERAAQLSGFGFQPIARLLPAALVAGVYSGAHGGEQGFQWPERLVFGDSLKPAIAR